jgi:hypothetical protein
VKTSIFHHGLANRARNSVLDWFISGQLLMR